MPTLPTKVQPGDLITSDFMNGLIDVCADLQQRVSQLETPTITPAGMQITALLPSGEKHIGDPLYIIGRGFDVQMGNIVTIDGIGVSATAGQDRDRELVATIPNVQGVTASGKNITVLVSNAKGTDMQDFIVFPAVETLPEGQIFVRLTQSPTQTLISGQSYTFIYTVQAITNLEETYAVSASTSRGWTAQMVDTNDAPISPAEIRMPSVAPPAGATQTVRIRVSIPAGLANNTTAVLRVTINSRRNSRLFGNSGGDDVTVGSSGPAPETIAIVVPPTVARLSASQPSADTTGGVVRIGAGVGNYRLAYSAQIRAGTVYTVLITQPADNRWTASLSGTGTTPVTSQNIGPVAADTNQPVFVFLRAVAGAPADSLTLRLTSTTNPNDTGHVDQPIALLP